MCVAMYTCNYIGQCTIVSTVHIVKALTFIWTICCCNVFLYCPPQLSDVLLCIRYLDGVMEGESAVVKASFEVVAPTLPFFPVLPCHVFFHLQQQMGIAHAHYKGTSSSDNCVEYVWICYALGWIASASIFICGLKCTQKKSTKFST